MNEVFKSRKLWGHFVSVPSCIAEYARRNHRNLRVEYEDKYMIITPKTDFELNAPPQKANRTDKYIKKGEYYQLRDYQWLPLETVKPIEYTNDGRLKMLEAWKKLKSPKQMEVGDIK
jgi:hypothetical protein